MYLLPSGPLYPLGRVPNYIWKNKYINNDKTCLKAALFIIDDNVADSALSLF